MANVTVTKDRYTAESLYQWDLNQVLVIYGLSLPSIPEIHFTNDAMDRAIVKQATMDAAGVITVDVPNSILQKPYKIKAYVCIYEGETFESLYMIEIPVKARNKPNDYTLEGDEEIYSFNALENMVLNVLADAEELKADARAAQAAAEAARDRAKTAETAAKTAQGKAETAQGAAETAQGAAETAQGKAETARAASETAATNAANSATAAANSATVADGSKTAAETARAAAETAHTAAEAARAAAEALLPNIAHMIASSYTGNGKTGSSNAVSVTFPTLPKLIILSVTTTTVGAEKLAILRPLSASYAAHGYIVCGAGNVYKTLSVKYSGNTVYWYNGGTADEMFNGNGVVYQYLALY